MKAPSIVIVDYGLGNIFSVKRALEHSGGQNVLISSNANVILDADYLVLPGVGAFENGIRQLYDRELVDPIVQYAKEGKPLLGICLGMQLLATTSEEFGINIGLNIIPGEVVPIPNKSADGVEQKVPYIGWSELNKVGDWENGLFDGVAERSFVYLVHSYHMKPSDLTAVIAETNYCGHRITIGIKMENVVGFQFHPEKSGNVGLAMLRSFLQK